MYITKRMEKALLAKRQLALVGSVTAEHQEKLSTAILYLNALDNSQITLFIDSAGGSMVTEFLLADIIYDSKAPVHGVVTGLACSAGFGILQACQRRKAYPHAKLMFHAPNINTDTRVDDEEGIRRELEVRKTYHAEQVSRFALRSGRTETEWKEWALKERMFRAEEALSMGMLDEVIHPYDQAPVSK